MAPAAVKAAKFRISRVDSDNSRFGAIKLRGDVLSTIISFVSYCQHYENECQLIIVIGLDTSYLSMQHSLKTPRRFKSWGKGAIQ